MKNYITSVILICFSMMLQAQTSSGKHHIKYLDINTGNSDYGVGFLNEDQIVFTASTSDKVRKNTKFKPHMDLYVGDVGEEGEIINKKREKGIIDKGITKTGATFTNDKKTVYYSAKKYSKRKLTNAQLYKAEIDAEGNWINVEKLSINKKRYNLETPTLNKENTKLYFSSDLPNSIGGKDIFVSEIKADGTLGEPKNLGDKVNTPKDEITPYIADNNFLYFSSNGREDTLGSFDIYTSEVFENTVSEPLHLESPINSINDDFAYIVNSDKGYFASNRLQGQENNDIYSFYIEPDKPEVCYQEVIGTVRDKDTEKVLPLVTVTITNSDGVEVDKLMTDENGNYRYNLDCRETFTVKASKQGYSYEEHIVNTANYTESPSLEVNQSLVKEFKEEKEKVTINIGPIYFGFDKYNLTDNAKLELDKIVKVMKANPDIEVESASHTDSRGTKAYNQGLSERRAKSTVDYIVSKGIERGRIKSKGYGETQLLNECKDGVRCAIAKHKLNRRTEFVIINKHVLNKPKESNEGAIIVISETVPKQKEKPKPIVTKKEIKKSDIPNVENENKSDLEPKEAIKNDEQPKLDNASSSNPEKVSATTIEKKEDIVDNTSHVIATVNKDSFKQHVVPDKKENVSQGISQVDTNINEYEKEEALPNASSAFKEGLNRNTTNSNKTNSSKKIVKQKRQTNEKIKESVIEDKPIEDAIKTAAIKMDKVTKTTESINKLLSTNKDSNFDEKPLDVNTVEISESIKKDLKENSIVTAEADKEPEIAVFNKDLSVKKNNMESAFNELFDKEGTLYDEDPKDKKADVKESVIEEEVLSISSIDISPMTVKRNGIYAETRMANKTDVMRINFKINHHTNITEGYKEVYILIQNPKGVILNRKGVFEPKKGGDKLNYTEKTNAYYTNNYLEISMLTDRFIQKIIKGMYTITIYIEGYPVGLEQLNLS